jgi:hypothetical protein
MSKIHKNSGKESCEISIVLELKNKIILQYEVALEKRLQRR